MKKRALSVILTLAVCLTSLAFPSAAAGTQRVPIYLGYVDVDYLAEQILAKIPTEGKNPSQQIRAVYDYIIKNYERDGWDGKTYAFDRQALAEKAQSEMERMENLVARGKVVLRQELDPASGYDSQTGLIMFSYDSNYMTASCAYDMILTRTGTCQHFAALLTLLLGHLGYDCRMIDGEFLNRDGTRVEHKWNCVLVDGRYYWLDVRMDHSGYESTGSISYTYFMKKDKAEWQARHVWDSSYSDWLFANAAAVEQGYRKQIADAVGPWGNCSDWAWETMQQAGEKGLIPEALSGQNLAAGISRAEFAAVAVGFYEVLTGKTAPAWTGQSPFSDTSDADVLRAYGLGIVSGTGEGLFAPASTLTREQAVAMLGRVWELADTGQVSDGSGLAPSDTQQFSDAGNISPYARPYVGFFTAKKVIDGIGGGLFSPKGTMTREQAIKVAFAAAQLLS